MRLTDEQLVGLRVETTTGERVGTIVGLVMDTDGGVIVQYRVRPPGALAMFLGSRELLIHQSQVVSFDAKRMVVQSGVGRSSNGGRRRRSLSPSPQPQPLASESE